MDIKTVPQSLYSQDLAPCDFWLFPKLSSCRYETIEEMKVAVMKVIDTLTPEGFHGAFQKLLERYNKCIAGGGDYFEGESSFMWVPSIKVAIRKKSGNLIYLHIYGAIGLTSRVFANGLGDQGSIPGRVIRRNKPGNRVALSPTSRCRSSWKGSLRVPLN